MTDRELLEAVKKSWPYPVTNALFELIRERLSQPEQEPVGEIVSVNEHQMLVGGYGDILPIGTLLYTAPQPEQKPLTDEQIGNLVTSEMNEYDIARAIEAAHGIKP